MESSNEKTTGCETILDYGRYRELNREEREMMKEMGRGYTVVVLEKYQYIRGDILVEVPAGFLSDGSSMSPDWGTAWIYHDYLYCTHKIKRMYDLSSQDYKSEERKDRATMDPDGANVEIMEDECIRETADEIMINVMLHEGRWFSSFFYKKTFEWNVFGKPRRSWKKAHRRGFEVYEDYIPTRDIETGDVLPDEYSCTD